MKNIANCPNFKMKLRKKVILWFKKSATGSLTIPFLSLGSFHYLLLMFCRNCLCFEMSHNASSGIDCNPSNHLGGIDSTCTMRCSYLHAHGFILLFSVKLTTNLQPSYDPQTLNYLLEHSFIQHFKVIL
jgi:hypothetical protein